jgi:predicted TIM-barrel fold metal-dependent hydrolase
MSPEPRDATIDAHHHRWDLHTSIVLTHAGLPLDRSADGLRAWRHGMRMLAERPNVCVKRSGLPMTDWRWTAESLRPLVLETIEIFGVARAMFGSNFPVDSLYSDYDTLVDAYRAITAGFSPDERRALFHDNAQRFFRL